MTNRFKGLDLIDRVPEELWIEVHDIVQEAVIETIPKKKKYKKAKWLSEEDLQIAEKRREAKVPHERLPELPVVPREKPHTGAAARENPRDAPVISNSCPSSR